MENNMNRVPQTHGRSTIDPSKTEKERSEMEELLKDGKRLYWLMAGDRW